MDKRKVTGLIGIHDQGEEESFGNEKPEHLLSH